MKKLLLSIGMICGAIFASQSQEIQNWSWAKTMAYGNMPRDNKNASRVEHVDDVGNYFVSSILLSSGNTTRPLTKLYFGSDSIIVGDLRQGMFLQKYDSTGNLIWSKTGVCAKTFWSNPGNISGLETDKTGNLFVSFHFYDTLVLGTDTFIETGDKAQVNLACLNANTGALKWSRVLLNNYDATNEFRRLSELTRIDLNTQNEVVTVVSSPQVDSITIFRHNNSGSQLFKKAIYATVTGAPFKMYSLNTSGPNIIVSGGITNSLSIGSVSLAPADGRACILSFDGTNGDFKWSRQIKSTEPGFSSEGSKCYDVLQDASGNVYFTGEFWGTFVMQGTTITFSTSGKSSGGSSEGREIYYGKLNSSGVATWIKQGGGEKDHGGRVLRMGNNGNVFLMGLLGSSVMTIGGDSIASPTGGSGTNRYFIAEFNNDGNVLWAKRVNSVGLITGKDVYFNMDAQNTFYFSGGYEFSSMALTFGSYTLPANIDPESSRFFVARSGERQGSGGSTGNKNIEATITFSVFPNPASESLQVTTIEDVKIEGLKIHTLNGQKVKESKKESTIQIADLPNGLYFIQVETNKGISTQKFIKN